MTCALCVTVNLLNPFLFRNGNSFGSEHAWFYMWICLQEHNAEEPIQHHTWMFQWKSTNPFCWHVNTFFYRSLTRRCRESWTGQIWIGGFSSAAVELHVKWLSLKKLALLSCWLWGLKVIVSPDAGLKQYKLWLWMKTYNQWHRTRDIIFFIPHILSSNVVHTSPTMQLNCWQSSHMTAELVLYETSHSSIWSHNSFHTTSDPPTQTHLIPTVLYTRSRIQSSSILCLWQNMV